MRIPSETTPFQIWSVFLGWWSEISSTIGTFIYPQGLNLKTLRYEEIGDAVGCGSFACVAKIKDRDLVIKTHFDRYMHHMAAEKSAYERVGRHPFILRYYHEAEVISKGERLPGLVLQYHRAGTLENSLNSPNYVDERSK